MSERKSNNRVSKRNTNGNSRKNLKVSYEKKKMSRNLKNINYTEDIPKNSNDDFPSLVCNVPIKNNSLAWRKSDNAVNTVTIYTKAKNGGNILNSHPIFPDTPEFILFQ